MADTTAPRSPTWPWTPKKMSRIINLRQARKQRDRATRRAEADANAARHGEAKPQRELRKARAEQAERNHQGHRIEPGDD